MAAEPIAKNRQDLERKLTEIRVNNDLNEGAKRRMIQEAYEGSMARHRELAAGEQHKTEQRITELERSVFAVSYPADATKGVDKERIRQSYRDAAFRVSGMEGEELERVLERAERTGDGQLARAVYHEATEKGIRNVADSYLENRPEDRKRWEDYTAARLESESVHNRMVSDVPPPEPVELAG